MRLVRHTLDWTRRDWTENSSPTYKSPFGAEVAFDRERLMEDNYLIWSNKRRMWWGAGGDGTRGASSAPVSTVARRPCVLVSMPCRAAGAVRRFQRFPCVWPDMNELLRAARAQHPEFDPELVEQR
jgi:hypothetical protein